MAYSIRGICFIYSLVFVYFFYGNKFEGPSPKRIQISRGESLSQIANALYSAKIIPSKFNFRIAAFLYGADKRIQAGRYYITSGLSYFDILDKFISGDGDILKTVDIYDGISITGLKNKLEKTVSVNPRDFASVIHDKNFFKKIGFKGSSLEGYLLPGEYDIYEKSSAEETVEAMYKKFTRFFNDTLQKKAARLGYSLHQFLQWPQLCRGKQKTKSKCL